MWHSLLLNQFHDVLPGSCTEDVVNDALELYNVAITLGSQLLQTALQQFVESSGMNQPVLFNTLGWSRREVVECPAGSVPQHGVTQQAADGNVLALVELPSLGAKAVASAVVSELPAAVSVSDLVDEKGATGVVLENSMVRVELLATGRIRSFYVKELEREAIAEGGLGNNFVMYDDIPLFWDAWDVEIYHLQQRHDVAAAKSLKVVEQGALRVTVELSYELSPHSTCIQRVSLAAHSPRLDFETHVEWHEAHKFLKVEFDLAIRSQQASYEVQFGHVQRTTHFNTTHDLARFEVCAQKWADLYEHGFGVALLNDSKYGYACHQNTLRLSLLRASKAPDANADMGHQHFRYAIFPHALPLQPGGVIEEAANFNNPLLSTSVIAQAQPAMDLSAEAQPPAPPQASSFFWTNQNSVHVDTVKASELPLSSSGEQKEENSRSVVVRVYEAYGGRTACKLFTSLPIQHAWLCNLLEENEKPITINPDRSISFSIRPFEVLSFKFVL
eukprot:TRINITY_DN13898_c0_g1_i5.p1 TRINITY_DN13898_c0_g1~~TRINITY_DN13898_c0_g1_i5.p1  ORF type:complete len:502 (+),score=136.38 TRINITY_DN13898_c0_g1_i5:372-1877(+)